MSEHWLEMIERFRVIEMAKDRLHRIGPIRKMHLLVKIDAALASRQSNHQRPDSEQTPFDVLLALWDTDLLFIKSLGGNIEFDEAIAALLERDGLTMPWQSVATGRLLLWQYVALMEQMHSRRVTDQQREVDRRMATNRILAAASQAHGKAKRNAIIDELVAGILRTHPNAKNPLLAARVWEQVEGLPEFKRMTKDGVTRRLGPAKRKYYQSLSGNT